MSTIDQERLSYKAGEDLVRGDIVKIDSNEEAVKVTTAEAKDAFGMVYADADTGEQCSIIVRGLVDDLRVLVEDTDQASGYDAAISIGDRLLITGKSGGTYVEGQALSSDQGTGATGGDGTINAKALEAVAGSTSEDTFTTIRAFVDFIN